MKIGIIGRKGSGKSVIYGALCGRDTSQDFEKKVFFTTVDVHDDRVEKLAVLYNTKKKIYNTFVFYDFPGYDLTDREVKEMDGYIIVTDGFNEGSEPGKEIGSVFEDMYLNDITILQKRHGVLTKGKKESEHDNEARTIASLLESYAPERSLYKETAAEERYRILKGFQLFLTKPVFCIVNGAEGSSGSGLRDIRGFPVFDILGKVELEISLLPEEEKKEYLSLMGIETPFFKKFTAELYSYMHLITFFSCSEKEIRAWQLRNGQTAVEAAGVIHTDIMKGFIKADVVNASDVIAFGGEHEAKKNNCFRLEGKEYRMKDGDIMVVKFQ
mgnify:CR=1 FL=1